jgi:hypothetical protein
MRLGIAPGLLFPAADFGFFVLSFGRFVCFPFAGRFGTGRARGGRRFGLRVFAPVSLGSFLYLAEFLLE